MRAEIAAARVGWGAAACAVAWLLAPCADARAQSLGLVVRDGSLGSAAAGVVPSGVDPNGAPASYLVTPELGEQRGANLFHSFSRFDLGTGETATFTGPDPVAGPQSVDNVIARVTGGTRSSLDGTLRSTIPGADLYLINPAGLSFGPNARLDVAGSFHASSADYLRLDSSERFSAREPSSGTLSVAAPAAFGFLSESPSSITATGSPPNSFLFLGVPAGRTLSLVGGELDLRAGTLAAPSGRIDLVGVASPGEVVFDHALGAPRLDVGSFARLARIETRDALVTTRGSPGGSVVVRAGELALHDSTWSSTTVGPADHPGLGMDLDVRGAVEIGSSVSGSLIASSSFPAQGDPNLPSGRGGDVRIHAGSLTVGGPANLEGILAAAWSPGAGGAIQLDVGLLRLSEGGFVRTTANGLTGRGGDVSVVAERVEILQAGNLGTFTLRDVPGPGGRAGDVHVVSDAIRVDGMGADTPTGIFSFTGDSGPDGVFPGGGDAGAITIETGTLELLQGGSVSARTFSDGRGGAVTIRARESVVARGSGTSPDRTTGVISTRQAGGSGDAGSITIETPLLDVSGDAKVVAFAANDSAVGRAGDIVVRADTIRVHDGGEINAGTFATGREGPAGRGGDIALEVRQLELDTNGKVIASTTGPGQAGSVEIDAQRIALTRGGAVFASAAVLDGSFGRGRGGDIRITADEILVAGVGPATAQTAAQLTSSGILAQSFEEGAGAGTVRIVADTLELRDGGRIGTETAGPGDAGDIVIESGRVRVSGFSETLRALQIAEGGTGNGAFSRISARSDPAGRGGTASGAAGDVVIVAPLVELAGGGRLESLTVESGDGGDVRIDAQRILLGGGARIDASALGEGHGGDLSLAARDVLLDGGSVLSARSAGTTGAPGAAGSIRILASGVIRLEHGSAITTESAASDGGNVSLNAAGLEVLADGSLVLGKRDANGRAIAPGVLLELEDSAITTSVGSGQGSGGNIAIDPSFVVLRDSRIAADAFGGPGGNVKIVSAFFFADPRRPAPVTASSQQGIDGSIDITAPDVDIASQLTNLPASFLDAAALLRERCAGRRPGSQGSFVVGGSAKLAPSPDDPLASASQPAPPRAGSEPPAHAGLLLWPGVTEGWRAALVPCGG